MIKRKSETRCGNGNMINKIEKVTIECVTTTTKQSREHRCMCGANNSHHQRGWQTKLNKRGSRESIESIIIITSHVWKERQCERLTSTSSYYHHHRDWTAHSLSSKVKEWRYTHITRPEIMNTIYTLEHRITHNLRNQTYIKKCVMKKSRRVHMKSQGLVRARPEGRCNEMKWADEGEVQAYSWFKERDEESRQEKDELTICVSKRLWVLGWRGLHITNRGEGMDVGWLAIKRETCEELGAGVTRTWRHGERRRDGEPCERSASGEKRLAFEMMETTEQWEDVPGDCPAQIVVRCFSRQPWVREVEKMFVDVDVVVTMRRTLTPSDPNREILEGEEHRSVWENDEKKTG